MASPFDFLNYPENDGSESDFGVNSRQAMWLGTVFDVANFLRGQPLQGLGPQWASNIANTAYQRRRQELQDRRSRFQFFATPQGIQAVDIDALSQPSASTPSITSPGQPQQQPSVSNLIPARPVTSQEILPGTSMLVTRKVDPATGETTFLMPDGKPIDQRTLDKAISEASMAEVNRKRIEVQDSADAQARARAGEQMVTDSRKVVADNRDAIRANNEKIKVLDQMEKILQSGKLETGKKYDPSQVSFNPETEAALPGFVRNIVPGMGLSNEDRQRIVDSRVAQDPDARLFNDLNGELTLGKAKMLSPVTDQDYQRLSAQQPGLVHDNKSNLERIRQLREVLSRDNAERAGMVDYVQGGGDPGTFPAAGGSASSGGAGGVQQQQGAANGFTLTPTNPNEQAVLEHNMQRVTRGVPFDPQLLLLGPNDVAQLTPGMIVEVPLTGITYRARVRADGMLELE